MTVKGVVGGVAYVIEGIFVIPELYKHLKLFVEKENQEYYSNRDEDLLNKARNGQIDIDSLIRDVEKNYKEEVLEYAEKIGPTDEDIFAQSFHRFFFFSQ